jgi:type IX secretion system PorP/SprF family membrane protein
MMAQPYFGEQGNLHYCDYELLINPASAGAVDRHLITLGMSKQWIGFDSPLSEIIQYQVPVTPTNSIGAWVYNESFGPQHNTQFGAAYAHSLKLGDNSRLSLGLSLSLLLRSERHVESYDPSDPVFLESAPSQTGFNAGFGAYYFTDAYYIGFSIPQWLTNELIGGGGNTKLENNFKLGQLQYYFIGGYRFKIGEKFALTPSILAELSKNTDFGYEGVLTATYDNRFEVGAGFASHTRLQFDVGIVVAKWLSFRYQYAQYMGSDYHKSRDHFIVMRIHWNKKINKE